MGLLDDAATWLLGTLETAAGRAAVYQRGGRRISVTVVRREIEQTIVDANGVDIVTRDYEITLDASPHHCDPQAGDVLYESAGGRTIRWEVVGRGNGAAWEWWDVNETAYRLSVQEV